MSSQDVKAFQREGVVVIEGLVVARMRDGRPEVVGSLVTDPLEAERKCAIANDVIGGAPWKPTRALLVLPEVLG